MTRLTADDLGVAQDVPRGSYGIPAQNASSAREEPEQVQEHAVNAEQIRQLAKESLDFLAALALPSVFKYLFCITFTRIWEWLCNTIHKTRDFSQLAIGLPRGFGKTMLIKIFILYCVLFTNKKFILIICGTQTKANNILSDVAGMLDEINIKRAFGDWKLGIESDRQDLKRFGFRGRNIIIMAAGCQSDIRGITLENARPDVMIFDDIQTREDADSEQVSNTIETWMIGTAMKAKSPEGCCFIFIGNMYPTKFSILRKLKYNPTWNCFIAGGIIFNPETNQAESLWEELQPLSQLLKEYENDAAAGKAEIFHAEVMNDENASVNRLIDIGVIPDDPYEGELHQGNFVIIDPSNDKSNSDLVSIGYFEIYDGRPVSREMIEGRLSPGDMNWEAIKLCLKYNCRLVCIEANAYQYTGLYWFQETCKKFGIQGIYCEPIYSGTRSKNARIAELFKRWMAKEQYIGRATKASTFAQVTSWNPLKTNNTDGILDCHTYAPKVVEEYGHLVVSTITLEYEEFATIPVRDESETSPF